MDDESAQAQQKVFKLVPKETPSDTEAAKAKEHLIGTIKQLYAAAKRDELMGLAYVGIYSNERFGIGWVGDVALPPMVGYLEFLQQQIIAVSYISGIDE